LPIDNLLGEENADVAPPFSGERNLFHAPAHIHSDDFPKYNGHLGAYNSTVVRTTSDAAAVVKSTGDDQMGNYNSTVVRTTSDAAAVVKSTGDGQMGAFNSTVVQTTSDATVVNTTCEGHIFNDPGTEPNIFEFDLQPVVNNVQPFQSDNNLPTRDCKEKDGILFAKLLKKIVYPQQTKTTVSAILAVSKMILGATAVNEMTAAMIKSLSSTHECTQSTAARYLSERKHPDDVWKNILLAILPAAKEVREHLKSTSRARSFRHLINRAISTTPETSSHVILNVYSNNVVPQHITATIGRWANKFVALAEEPVWHQILAALSLEDKFRVTLHGKNRVVVQLLGKSTLYAGNPCSQLLWNVNGLASRWMSDDKFTSEENHPSNSSAKKIKKTRQFARKQEKADFRAIILKAGIPDLITIVESKISLNKLLSLHGFMSWCESMKYQFIALSFSTSEIKGGAGYAGVMTLSKYQPLLTSFDFAELPTDEARVITHEFKSFVHVSVYSPCTGYDPIKMSNRLKFDSDLTIHLLNQQKKTGKPLLCSGDLNINPRRQDWNEKAFVSLFKLRESKGNTHHPGCSPQELSSYEKMLTEAKVSNAWEDLYPYSTEGMTWHPPTDPHGFNCWGQRRSLPDLPAIVII
jgi:exonuclease III